jgi:uncharacterized NAD-dependent epimerase/dehydratase family protein
MYRSADVVAVLDPEQAGKTAGEVLGFGGDVPVVGTVEEALARRPEVAIVGTAPRGGALEADLRGDILACLRAGVDVVSGMHEFLEDDAEFGDASKASGAGIWDVRRVPSAQKVSAGDGCTTGARSVLLVGTDCNVGKMTVTVELYQAAVAKGVKAAWAATGQTGIILRERGLAVDRVIADFIGGAAEDLVNEEGAGKDLVFVEGQGAIVHPGYAGVTLGLMYGVMPDCMILVHSVERDALKRLETPVRPLPELIDLHQNLMAPFKNSPIVGVALNTSSLDEASARKALGRVRDETGLPAADVVRFGCDPLLEAALVYLKIE